MKYEWIDEYILKMPGVTKDLQKDWNWIRYQIGGKMFAAICLDDNDKPYYIMHESEDGWHLTVWMSCLQRKSQNRFFLL